MSIVVITIPGDAQKHFVNTLHRETRGGVKLVIVQKPRRLSLGGRLLRFCRRAGFPGVITEAWYALLLRLSPRMRGVLTYFQVPPGHTQEEYLPRVMWADSVNSDAVYDALKAVSPSILAVWGSAILEPRIIAAARTAVNLHFGHSPQYRGALANQHAVLNAEYALVGATIHHVRDTVDGGDILEQLRLDLALPPHEAFALLTKGARRRFVDVVKKLHQGESIAVRTQDTPGSNVMLLRQWLPSVRYATARRMQALERAHPSYVEPAPRRGRVAALGLAAAALSGLVLCLV